jgi:hypothetical protein
MKRLCVALCALLFVLGCASDGDKGEWDEFWKDLRGDNMKMHSDFSRTRRGESQPAPVKTDVKDDE